MSRFDRYLLSQLLMLFGFFALVLVAVYWVNRAVSLFDQLIGDGQSALVFLEMTTLTLPGVIRLVLPVAAFAAAAYVTNRLSSESELVVMQATGFSAFRLARPVLYFGVIVALIMSALVHVVVPASRQALSEREYAISQNITARLLRPGVFQFPSSGVTLYIREITESGELRDIFMSDARAPDGRTTYTAEHAYIASAPTGPKMVLVDGIAQTLTYEGRRLALTRFSNYTYNLSSLMSPDSSRHLDDGTLSTLALIRADEETAYATMRSVPMLIYEGHNRIAQPFLATAAAMIGFAALMVGAFSRFGLWRQLLGGTVLLVLVQMIANTAETLGIRDARLWPLVWVAPVAGLAISAGLLWWSQRVRRPRGAQGQAARSAREGDE